MGLKVGNNWVFNNKLLLNLEGYVKFDFAANETFSHSFVYEDDGNDDHNANIDYSFSSFINSGINFNLGYQFFSRLNLYSIFNVGLVVNSNNLLYTEDVDYRVFDENIYSYGLELGIGFGLDYKVFSTENTAFFIISNFLYVNKTNFNTNNSLTFDVPTYAAGKLSDIGTINIKNKFRIENENAFKTSIGFNVLFHKK